MPAFVCIGRPESILAWMGKGITEVTLAPRGTAAVDNCGGYLDAEKMLLLQGYKPVSEDDDDCPSRPIPEGKAFYKLVDDDDILVPLRRLLGDDSVIGHVWGFCGAELWL